MTKECGESSERNPGPFCGGWIVESPKSAGTTLFISDTMEHAVTAKRVLTNLIIPSREVLKLVD